MCATGFAGFASADAFPNTGSGGCRDQEFWAIEIHVTHCLCEHDPEEVDYGHQSENRPIPP